MQSSVIIIIIIIVIIIIKRKTCNTAVSQCTSLMTAYLAVAATAPVITDGCSFVAYEVL